MSGRDHSDDSSGNLAAGQPTVPDFTADTAHPGTPDPNDTQQDPQVTRRSKQDQNVTNDPTTASRRNDISHGAADGDTMDDPLAARDQAWPDALALDVTMEEPLAADKKCWADPLAPDETLQEEHGQGREINPDLLAFATPDTTDDLLHELFQSAIKYRAGIAADGIDSAANVAEKTINRSQRDNLFDGRFELLTELGAGGMGRVFKAHDTELDRTIAIKVLSLFGRDANARIERFRQEARAAAKLSHPNIIKIHDLHTANTGERYIQFEYVEGCSLSNLLVEHKKKGIVMPVKTVLDVAIQSLAALDCMHENNIVHRDVKPGNIMLERKTNARGFANSPHDALQEGARTARLDDYSDEEYRVKLVDFGLAKIRDEDDNTMMSITRKGQAVGTAAYMSPEQCGGERVDGCSDIYSLGCVLFEMLTGHVPFRGSDSAETMRLHQNADIPLLSLVRPKLPAVGEFERIVNKMLAKNRENRYRKAEHARNDLKELYIGIKSGAIMEALQAESENNVTDARSLPLEPNTSVPKVDIPGGAVEDLQAIPGAFDPTVSNLHKQPASKQPSDASSRDSQADPQKAERKIYADPLAPDQTSSDLAQFQQTARSASGVPPSTPPVTNWDPVAGGGSPKVPNPSAQNKKAVTSAAGAVRDLKTGDIFEKHVLLKKLGEGGMGTVYMAEHQILKRIHAIKLLKAKSGISMLEIQRFQQEAEVIAKFKHENIPYVHDMGVTADGDPYCILEYLEGESLEDVLKKEKTLPLNRVLAITSQICDALQHAHERGVIHRDVKPSNLMLALTETGREQVKLLDFGIAKLEAANQERGKLTQTGDIFGTPRYMSPEQCSAQKVEATSDIYSLGCVLYEMLSGRPPFTGATPFDTLTLHKEKPHEPLSKKKPDLAQVAELDLVLDKMLAKDSSDRYQSATEVKEAIEPISQKLLGEPLSRTRSITNGLSDARGKKTVALIVAALATLATAAYLVSQVSKTVNTKTPDVVPVPPKSWKSYDIKGQRLFDTGSYSLAEEEFRRAYEKAKADQSQKGRLRLVTSLLELRMLYTAWKNTERANWANSELIDLNAYEFLDSKQSEYSWDDITTRLSRAKSPDDLKQVVEMARDLTVKGNRTSRKQDTLQMLSSLRKKIERIPNSELVRDQFILLEGFQYKGEGRSIPAEVQTVVSKLIAQPAELISPDMANVLVAVGFGRTNVDPYNLEKFSEYALQQSSHPFGRLAAQVDLSRIYMETDRRGAATETIEQCITEAEKQVPRHYFALLCALEKRADLYASSQSFSAAIHLYLRALSISECVPSVASFGVRSNVLRVPLATAYVGAGKDEEAEKTLVAIIEDQDPSANHFRADSLRQLGLLYLRQKKLDKAEDSLEKSVAIFKSQKSLVRYYSNLFEAAKADLARVRIMRQSQGVNRSTKRTQAD